MNAVAIATRRRIRGSAAVVVESRATRLLVRVVVARDESPRTRFEAAITIGRRARVRRRFRVSRGETRSRVCGFGGELGLGGEPSTRASLASAGDAERTLGRGERRGEHERQRQQSAVAERQKQRRRGRRSRRRRVRREGRRRGKPPRFPAGRARAREFGRRSRVSRRREERALELPIVARGDAETRRAAIEIASRRDPRRGRRSTPRRIRSRARTRRMVRERLAGDVARGRTPERFSRARERPRVRPRGRGEVRSRILFRRGVAGCVSRRLPRRRRVGRARSRVPRFARGRVGGRSGRVRGGASPSIRVGTPVAFDGRDARRRIRGSGTRAEEWKRGRVESRVPFAVGSAAAD